MPQLPETALPELRAKWLKLAGAKEIVQHAIAAGQAIEADYHASLNMVLRMMEMDPAKNWSINLETGEINESPVDTTVNGYSVPNDPSIRVR